MKKYGNTVGILLISMMNTRSQQGELLTRNETADEIASSNGEGSFEGRSEHAGNGQGIKETHR